MTHPEHDKLREVANRRRAEFRPIGIGIQQLLAQWTGIDFDRLEWCHTMWYN